MIYYQDGRTLVYQGDCIDVLATLDPDSVDAIVCDPPYGLEFMGKEWDRFKTDRRGVKRTGDVARPGIRGEWKSPRPSSYDAGSPFQEWCAIWGAAALRVLKPGGHMLVFGGTRTWHRLIAGIEDAGFEIRDTITWIYASGFPKSHDISKAIDKAAGAEREVMGPNPRTAQQTPAMSTASYGNYAGVSAFLTAPATDDAARWQGWGTALKPASEPIVVARKPFKGSVAANVLAYGTGALNIDGTRVGSDSTIRPVRSINYEGGSGIRGMQTGSISGRWPANVVLSHLESCTFDGDDAECAPECPVAELDMQSGKLHSQNPATRRAGQRAGGLFGMNESAGTAYWDSGGASRFFTTFRWQAKAPSRERPKIDGVAHPTVKPLALMQWLVRLVAPQGALILDPFAGSGTTVEACILEGMACLAVEREAEYLPLIKARIDRQAGT